MNVKNVKVSFQVQIPAKLILFGEWGVLKGYSALGCSVGKYFECKVEEADTQNLIIESPEISFEWNGTVRNQQISTGVYVYTIHVTYSVNGAITEHYFKGDVTLIR